MRKIIGPWMLPHSPDWSDLGGEFRAIVHILDGCIIDAQLYEWRVVKHVCFGRGDHVRGWIPSGRKWRAALTRGESDYERMMIPEFEGVPKFNLGTIKIP